MAGSQQMLLGSGGRSYPAIGGSVTASSVSPTNAQATLRANADGTISGSVSTGGSTPGLPDNYVLPAADAAGLWVRLTVTAGSSPTGGDLTGTWLACTANRSWILSRTVLGTASGTWQLQFATDSGGANIVNTGSFSVSAEEA